MTVEADVRRDACESEVSKCEDNVTVNVGVIGNVNGISKDDGDGSYVFVTGSDAVAASDESDLANGHCAGGVETNGGGRVELEESVVVVENPQSELQFHSKAAEESKCSGDGPEITVESSCLQSEGDQQSAKEVVVEDVVQGAESTSQAGAELDKQVVSGPESKENGDGVPVCDGNDAASVSDPELKENGNGVPACDGNDIALASAAEQNGSSESGRSLAADSVEVKVHLETQVGNGIVSDENGDALPTHDVQESLSKSLVTNRLVDRAEKINESCDEKEQSLAANGDIQNSTSKPVAEEANGDIQDSISEPLAQEENSVSEPDAEEDDNGSSEQTDQTLTTNVDVKDPFLEPIGTCEENGQTSAANVDVQDSLSKPIAEENNGLGEENGHILAADVNNQEIILENLTDRINGDSCQENGRSLAQSVELQQLETEIISGLVSDKSGDESLIIHGHEESILKPMDTNPLASTPEENGSCENEDVLVAPVEVQKQVETPVASGPISDQNGNDMAIVHSHQEKTSVPDLIDTHEENKSSDKAFVCQNLSVGNGESFVAVADTIVSDENENSLSMEDNSTRSIDDGTPEQLEEKNNEKLISFPLEQSKPEVEAESSPIEAETSSSFAANDAVSELNSKYDIEAEIVSVTEDSLSSGLANNEASEADLKSELTAESVCPASDTQLVSNLKSEIESGHVPVVDDTQSSCPVKDVISEPISISEYEPKIPPATDGTLSSSPADDAIQEPKTSRDSIVCENLASNDVVPVVDSGMSDLETECADKNEKPTLQINDSVEDEAILPASSGADESSIITDDKPESEESSIIPDDKPEFEVTPVDSLEGQDKIVDVEKRPFYYLIRIPRNDDENLKEQIKHAQLKVEEKTKERDAVRSKMQMQRAICKEHKLKFEAAISDERAAQELLKSKRQEMDSVQFMNSKVKDALSLEEIANTIRHLEHTMAHETVSLKEEKQYIRDIKQLKQRRDQLSYSLGKQDEVQQSLDQKGQIEERIKDLRKEMDQLKENLLKAQGVTQVAKRKYNGENDMLHELQYQFEAADAIRQEAYVHLQSLRKQNYEKTKHFWRYRNDAKAANDLALSGDKEQLQHLCINQVETFMELWNTNDDFRKEYIKCNTRSTLRRLRTLDGRQLGPDEEPPVIPDIVRVTRHNLAASVVSTTEPAKRVAIVESEEPNDKSVEIVERNNETAKIKKPVKVASSGISQATVSGRTEIVEEIVEDPKPTKEEVELARKEEELRKEEEAAKLRDQRKQEEKAKAKEAMERKKRIAEKAQVRAAIKAQKEAEEKEKEREKRVRKKERKKENATKATNGINEGESAPERTSETTTATPVEPEATEKPVTITKRSQKMQQFTKQSKAKPIPLPLRNRSKRRMQPWMWVLVAVVAVLGLFLLGNGGSFSFRSMLERFF
ncbi:uncharacterized protein LOC126793588 [Argentina anserina]|uniref:uncharacterized protein LOC126793588 n=1 Tax=Argentina anserina TaxID=57926 RepID=UPI0021763951|nr:uncharacterized protein LOC126793588 [Potentilla anserina]